MSFRNRKDKKRNQKERFETPKMGSDYVDDLLIDENTPKGVLRIFRKNPDSAFADSKRAFNERGSRVLQFDESGDIESYFESASKEIHFRAGAIKNHIVEIGGLLVDVKQKMRSKKSYDFKKWVDSDNCPFSHSTALNYMRVYRFCAGAPELVNKFKPSVLYKLSAPSFPEELREEIKKHAEAPDFADSKKLHLFIADVANGKIDISKDEMQSRCKEIIADRYSDKEELRYRQELTELQRELGQKLRTISKLNGMGRGVPGLTQSENTIPQKYLDIQVMLEDFIGTIGGKLNNLHHDS